jgi:hypothetical protein
MRTIAAPRIMLRIIVVAVFSVLSMVVDSSRE